MPAYQPAWVARTTQTRSDIEAAALDLYLRDGFDATTVERIVEAAGVARRTFFRYFASKEAVLFAQYAARQIRVLEAMRARPGDEPPLMSLLAVLGSFADEPIDAGRAEVVRRIVSGSTWLRDRQQRLFIDEFADMLTEELAVRAGSGTSRVALRAVVISAVGCIEAAAVSHLRDPRTSVRDLFDDAVTACRSAWGSLP